MQRVTGSIRNFLFTKGTNSNFIRLFFTERLLLGLASALVSLFTPIFLFEISGESFVLVGLYYIVSMALYVLLLVPGMKIVNRIGFSNALALSMLFGFFQHVLLFSMDAANVFHLIPLLTLAALMVRIFHWVPYHVDFASFTRKGERGKDMAIVFATIAIMGMFGPILAAFVIQWGGFSLLYAITAGLLLLAGISYLFIKSVEQQFTWTYRETLSHIFSKKFRPVGVACFGNGIESALNVVVWPIFLYLLLDGEILEVGSVTALIVGGTVLLQLFIGAYVDVDKQHSITVLRRGSILYSLGWIVKIFVFSALHVFLIGVYHNIVRIFVRTPYSSILYDTAGEQGQYIDEFTVMREMAHFTGRIVTVGVMIILTFYFPLAWVFAIGVIASLLFNALYYAQKGV